MTTPPPTTQKPVPPKAKPIVKPPAKPAAKKASAFSISFFTKLLKPAKPPVKTTAQAPVPKTPVPKAPITKAPPVAATAPAVSTQAATAAVPAQAKKIVAKAAEKTKEKPKAAQTKKPKVRFGLFDDPTLQTIDVLSNEEALLRKHNRLVHVLTTQALGVAVLAMVLILGMPFFQTRYMYYAIPDGHSVQPLTPLSMPNLTNGTIRSWAASSVTEILTVGFGDYNSKISAQKKRFTKDGWADFVHAFIETKFGDALRKSQLVLTTVPSENPEILSQSVNRRHVYEWVVKIPLTLTYATNNDVAKHEYSNVILTIVRVPYDETNSGIAIDAWRQG